MKHMTMIRLLAGILVITFICFSLTANAFSSELLKVKGFYIGMSIDDALKNFDRLGFEGLKIREETYKKINKYYAIRPGSGDPFRVETGLNVKTVSKIHFSPKITNRLFNTRGINAEIFKNTFMEAYKTVNMEPYMKNPGSDIINGWEYYNLEQGCRIRISINKEVEIIKTAKKSEFKFD